jgi:hypothetical protein
MLLNSSMSKTLRNLRLPPGTAYAKKILNSKKPKVVSPSNFFPGSASTTRPTINTIHSVVPTQVSVESMFPGPKEKSAFNLNARTLRLRKKQENAIKEAEGKEVLAFPMNESQGGIEEGGRRRTRKHRRKHSRRKHSRRK